MSKYVKHFVINGIMANPSRYGIDSGDLNLINDYFVTQGWQTLTREQHTAIAAVIRYRNYYLSENEAYDHRTKSTGFENIGQRTIYDFMDNETATQSKKLIHYWSADPDRFDFTNSRIKKSVRGVDNDHITAAKIMYPLLAYNPKLQQRRQRKVPIHGALNNVFDEVEETIYEDTAR